MHQGVNSSDGRRAAFVVTESGQGDIWLMDQETDKLRALTSTAVYEENVVWSPDSQEIIFRRSSLEDEFIRMRADGSDAENVAFSSTVQDRTVIVSAAWLPGDWLVVEAEESGGAHDLLMLQLDDPTKIFDFVTGRGDQHHAKSSPDGRAVAYKSDESGNLETYLVSIAMKDGRPAVGSSRQRVPVENPVALEWSVEGDELFMVTAMGAVFTVPIDWQNGRPRVGDAAKLFDLPAARVTSRIAVNSDSDRFMFLVDPEAEYQTLSVLVNWPARLEKP